MKRKVHVIPHSHWDREWYFTTSRSKVYLMKDLKDVLDKMCIRDRISINIFIVTCEYTETMIIYYFFK